MLKIKDNVVLKELEKYGAIFKYDIDTGEIEEIWFVDEKKRYCNTYIKLLFKKTDTKETKILFYKRSWNDFFKLRTPITLAHFENYIDLLYELIKDGLVEKVED